MSKKNYVYGNYSCKTDIGKVRMTNEDRAGVFTNAKGNILLIVCDGMGGQQKGEYAAQIALTTISESFLKKQKFLNSFTARTWLFHVVREANKKIYEEKIKLLNGDSSAPADPKAYLGLYTYLENKKNLRKIKLVDKKKIVDNFEKMMGPALREGTWQPEGEYS